MSLSCRLVDQCSGCDRLHFDRIALENDRRTELSRLGLGEVPVTFEWIKAGGLRDRLEFSLEPAASASPKLGLLDKTRSHIVDIEACPQLSLALQRWLVEFRQDLPNVPARRSVRLRVSPKGLRGVWLDFANEDIRDLLDDGAWLSRMLAKDVIVEVGQKRKRVALNPAGPRAHRLIDATLEPWFETSMGTERVELFATIGTFTQPGFEAAHTLVKITLAHANLNKENRVAEFGSGIGTFTLPLLATGATVDVFESDRLALSALERGVANSGLDPSRLTIHAGDFILSARAADSIKTQEREYDVVLVDPPRSGLGRFIDAIHARAKNAKWIYISCYPESFAKDARALAEKGLRLSRMTVVEQFPFTHHFEIVASFEPAAPPGR